MKRLAVALVAAPALFVATPALAHAAPSAATDTSVASVVAAAPSWPVLASGSTGANVRAVQHLLTARGYATTADGIFGSGTASVVMSFQRSRGLTADGVVGAQTWGALVTTVREGSNNTYVRAAQVLLNKNGAALTVDGVFGSGTKTATVNFQRAKGITADGIIGAVTWQYLAGSTGGTTTPTNCSAVTGPAPITDTTLVYGYSTFRVHKCLAPNLRNLLSAAKSAGHYLGGWSYRSNAQQIELRKQNCGTTYYAIYQMPASQCSPPTAIPGTSMHERGLALDFNSSGGTLTAGAFTWLQNNAARYGLYNLPSERWHWSTNGR